MTERIPLTIFSLFLALLASCGGSVPAQLETSQEGNNPVPLASSVSPANVMSGVRDVIITVKGSNFVPTSVIRIKAPNNPEHKAEPSPMMGTPEDPPITADRMTNVISSTELRALLTGDDVIDPGIAEIMVFNPSPGGGQSNTLQFFVDNPTPTIAALTPSSVTAGGTDFTLTISGKGFTRASARTASIPGSVVRWNALDRPTTFVSDTELQAAIPASAVVAAGTAEITVFNPEPGGGTSNAAIFTVSSSLTAGVLQLVSVSSDGAQANDQSSQPLVSADGSFVAFSSSATNLVTIDTNNQDDTFIHATCLPGPSALCNPFTLRVLAAGENPSISNDWTSSLTSSSRLSDFSSLVASLARRDDNSTQESILQEACGISRAGCSPSTSSDGRFIAFSSLASHLVSGDINGAHDIFVRDTCFGAGTTCTPTTTLVSVATGNFLGNRGSFSPSISPTGRFVAFASFASNLVTDDTNGTLDIFVRDTCLGAGSACTPSTVRVSVTGYGTESNGSSNFSSLSDDGRFVAFASFATNLVTGDTNGALDIFVRDTCLGAGSACTPSTVRVSVAGDGTESNGSSNFPSLSGDGRFVAFVSFATNLVTDDTNRVADVFLARTGY